MNAIHILNVIDNQNHRVADVRDLKEHLPDVYGRNGTHGPYLFLLLHGMALADQVQRSAHGALFTEFI